MFFARASIRRSKFANPGKLTTVEPTTAPAPAKIERLEILFDITLVYMTPQITIDT